MKIKSNKVFLKKCQKGEFTTIDVYNYIEQSTRFELEKLLLLKLDFLEFKKRFVNDNINKAQTNPMFITMQLNKEHIPLITNFEKTIEETTEIEKHEEIFDAEVHEFCDLFFPGHFNRFDQAERVLSTSVDQIIKELHKKDDTTKSDEKNQIQNSGIEFMGTELEFAELIKSLIAAKKLRGKSEKFIYEEMAAFLQLGETNKKQKLDTIGSRTKDITPFLINLEDALEKWNRSVK
ncbi:hypothetical protein [Gillisia sp. Hel_I_29]|uniref:hypothetical protein n=1 Tax=Gillisia sp. Hel_I_29 TaxID=1249975 RepID=UPI000557B738|nr:hypothetical protein [Gillisia sp. Hel_I_29]